MLVGRHIVLLACWEIVPGTGMQTGNAVLLGANHAAIDATCICIC